VRTFIGSDMSSIYRDIAGRVLKYPEFVIAKQDVSILELRNVTIHLKDPTRSLVTNPGRKLSNKYCAGELAFYLSCSEDLADIAAYSSKWVPLSDDGKTVNSCYGRRLLLEEGPEGYTPIEMAIEQLIGNKYTKKAVAIVYKDRDVRKDTRDTPCTMYLNFWIRNDQLSLTTHMRSNDVWYGTPYDIFFFTFMQQYVLARLKKWYPEVSLGSYFHVVDSLHAYSRNMNSLFRVSNAHVEQSPQMFFGEEEIHDIQTFVGYARDVRTGADCEPPLFVGKFFQEVASWLKGAPSERN
jgi:thymidylate synthase